MKRSGRHISKKGLTGLIRITLGSERVWKYKGNTYKTLREVPRPKKDKEESK